MKQPGKKISKRTFLKTSAALIASSGISSLSPLLLEGEAHRKNWAGNLTYQAEKLHVPESVPELQEIVQKSSRVRALGSRHCFNRMADSTGSQISLEKLSSVTRIDEEAGQVIIRGGLRYGDLCPFLHKRGYALHNLASLPHISIPGACATATHGSGIKNGNLATAVAAMELVRADGELVRLSREKDGETFSGAVVGLGALGIVTQMTLDLQPTFEMVQHVYRQLPLPSLQNHFDTIFSSGYSVSLFTDWQTDRVNQVWIKRKTTEAPEPADQEFYGAQLARRDLHPIAELSSVNCTRQGGISGPWFERLPHFRMDFTPSTGKELQSEYFVAREDAPEVAGILRGLSDKLAPLLMISEIRSVAEDDLWMSTSYGRPSVAFHFTWKQDGESLRELLPQIEEKLEPYRARPHWGKIFTLPPDRLKSRYEKLPDFEDLLEAFDPPGKFRNRFLEKRLLSG